MIVQLSSLGDRLHLEYHVLLGVPGSKRAISNRTMFSGRCTRSPVFKVESELFLVHSEVSIEIETV